MIRRALVLAVVLLTSLSVQAVTGRSDASNPTPRNPTGLRLVTAGDTSITVSTGRSAYATGYRLYASTSRTNLYVVNLSRAHRSRVWPTPTMTVYGLPRTDQPYYYRVEAVNSTRRSFSVAINQAGLRPATPTSPRATSDASGTRLTWSSSWASGFTIAQATNPAMTAGRRDYTSTSTVHRFTPYGLARGTRYYFQIRAANYGARSRWSGQVSVVAAASEQTVRVVTYNILQMKSDGTRDGGVADTIAPWSRRRLKAAQLIEAAAPDVVAVEEGWPWASRDVRQVDSLVQLLPGYATATTEKPKWPNYGWNYGDYVVYNTHTIRPVGSGVDDGTGGIWELGHQCRAAYQILRSTVTRPTFLFVALHLSAGANDPYRRTETQSLLAQIATFNARHGRLPVVSAGDYNADRRGDGPGALLEPTLDETSLVAQTKYRPTYDSYNQYRRRPPRYSLYLDRIFVTPGVAVQSWGIVLQLSRGYFTGVIPSDHNPVYARVTVPYQP